MTAAPTEQANPGTVQVAVASGALLDVQGVTFGYASPVLRGVSLAVNSGELAAIIGPNGAGKSTLLRLILGILRPSSGKLRILGHEVNHMTRRDVARLVGYVPQQSLAMFPLTALEYVLQGRFAQGRLIGFESDRDVEEAHRAMELTDTAEFSGRLMHELSGGERQRVTLARAIASRPKLLVLDEPVANLDIAHQVKILDLVSRLTSQEKMGAIVVTHELNLAAEFATTILLLKSGQCLAAGPPSQVIVSNLLKSLFETDVLVDTNPATGAPRVTLLAPSHNSGRPMNER